jgi:hypothetical protein
LKGSAASSIIKHNLRDPLVLVVPECVAAARLICQTANPRPPAQTLGQQNQGPPAAARTGQDNPQQQQQQQQEEGLRDGTRIAIIDAGEWFKWPFCV